MSSNLSKGYSLCWNIWALDSNIKSELGLLLIISSLSAKTGYCYASNHYLSNIFGISETSISKKIKKLESCGYLQIDYKKRGCEVIKRELRINFNPNLDLTKVKSWNEEKLNRTVEEKLNRTVEEKLKDNNISNNNISNKNISNIKKAPAELERENFSKNNISTKDITFSKNMDLKLPVQKIEGYDKCSKISKAFSVTSPDSSSFIDKPEKKKLKSLPTLEEVKNIVNNLTEEEIIAERNKIKIRKEKIASKRQQQYETAKWTLSNTLRNITKQRTDNPQLQELLDKFVDIYIGTKGLKVKSVNWETLLDLLYEYGSSDKERIEIVKRSLANSWLSFYKPNYNDNKKSHLFISEQHLTDLKDKDDTTIKRATDEFGNAITF